MKFKGSVGLMICGIIFEEEIFETSDDTLIKRLLNHPALGHFFYAKEDEPEPEEETEEVKKKKHASTIRAEKMRAREARGLELAKSSAKELYVVAKGLGYGGEPLSKDNLIIEIIKMEEDLKTVSEEGEDDSQ